MMPFSLVAPENDEATPGRLENGKVSLNAPLRRHVWNTWHHTDLLPSNTIVTSAWDPALTPQVGRRESGKHA